MALAVNHVHAQTCPALSDPLDCSPPGSTDHGVSQARILEWVATPPRDLPNRGIEPMSPLSPALQVDSLPAEPLGRPLYLSVISVTPDLFDPGPIMAFRYKAGDGFLLLLGSLCQCCLLHSLTPL